MAKSSGATSKKNTLNTALLRYWNTWLAGLYAVQGLLVLLLASGRSLPVQVSYTVNDPIASQIAGHTVTGIASRRLFDVPLEYLVAGLFLTAAVICGLAALAYREKYTPEVFKRTNTLCWIGFGIGASLLTVTLALLHGVADILPLGLLVILLAAGSAAGLARERIGEANRQVGYLLQAGLAAGVLAPLLVFGVQLWSMSAYGGQDVPMYLYGMYASLIGLAAAYVLVKRAQHKKVGRWADRTYVEQVYLILALIAVSGLAWQIYGGALRP